MPNETALTRAIFRVWRAPLEGVIALLLDVEASPRCVSVYDAVERHTEGDFEKLMSVTRPATAEEYASLKRELEAIGYRVFVRQRRTWPSTARVR